ncbi:MAG: hypothetical protein PHE74_10330 [Comamonas sp.]|uniref:DUF1330 domain-containing protein n=1 Tax=Comamonas resistens TaxID=3046670 RepID=A0ABY8SM98_9BURK|nr:DUF6616 family protein [Comamonas resistens]MDD3018744.1 hypothetical protein [Comamonas sp.]MDL5038749.1 hypothetical protein [Comamonas resistens]WHS64192.1 hypothetical protein QMY55_17015 [Comamonas resistens]
MSHYLVELYTPNAAWRALPVENRQRFLDGIQAAMGELSSLGVEVLALGETDKRIDRASEHRFLGIWRFPDIQARNALLAGIKASGWYDYFDHVNAASDAGGFTTHLAALAAG